MQCILSALKAESDPLVNYFQLKRHSSSKFPVFVNNDLYLIGIGIQTMLEIMQVMIYGKFLFQIMEVVLGKNFMFHQILQMNGKNNVLYYHTI